MGWQKLLMKRGVGSPGHIARTMAKSYRARKSSDPSAPERTIVRQLFVERIAAQTPFGGPVQYKFLRSNPSAIEALVDQHLDLFSMVTLVIFIEHPELVGPGAPADAFDVLSGVVQEVLDDGAPKWRTEGVWRNRPVVCSLCRTTVDRPNPALMSASMNENGGTDFLCEECAPPLRVRAISALGFFMGR